MFVLNETNVFRVCCTPVDMRQGILRLSQLVRRNTPITFMRRFAISAQQRI
ncbi:hypothetical protein [Prevotella ihumii]|uniref:hypothetical protein n=1 Tax=Prevotella ihumii TaxID=1917878 RepID=UPI001F1B0986|nr:hypothetical protein [Prevotella ihumii]